MIRTVLIAWPATLAVLTAAWIAAVETAHHRRQHAARSRYTAEALTLAARALAAGRPVEARRLADTLNGPVSTPRHPRGSLGDRIAPPSASTGRTAGARGNLAGSDSATHRANG